MMMMISNIIRNNNNQLHDNQLFTKFTLDGAQGQKN